MKKNIIDYIEDKSSETIGKFEQREDKSQLKKILFWLIVFFPYAIYLFLFKTKVNKILKLLVIGVTLFFSLIFWDIAVYPNRVYDSVAKDSYEEFILENPQLKLDSPLYASKNTHFELNDKIYFSFNIYDKMNMYYAIFEINDVNKDYKLVSLYDIDYNFQSIYALDEFEAVKEVHPVVVSFILANNKESIPLSNIKAKTKVKDGDLLKNILHQEVFINNKSYMFEFTDFSVVSIDKGNENLYKSDINLELNMFTPKEVDTIIKRNFDSNYKLCGYNYVNSSHFYHLEVAGKEYYVKYLPNNKTNLFLIDDREIFISDLEFLMRK